MTIQGIKEKVRAIMNEAGKDETLALLSEDTVKLDDYIASCIPDAVNLIVLSSPLRYLNASSVTSIVNNVDGIGVVDLPSDFLRLASIKLDTWKRAVFTAFEEGSEEYKIQHNPVTRSGANKPCCALSYNSNGPALECFPSGALSYFFYVRSADSDVTGSGLGQLKDILHPAVCYMCASLVYDIFEMQATSERMKAIAISLIPQN